MFLKVEIDEGNKEPQALKGFGRPNKQDKGKIKDTFFCSWASFCAQLSTEFATPEKGG